MAIEISIIDRGEERFLNLPPKFSASFQYQSGLFKNEAIPGSYAMGFKIPVEGNARILGLAHKIEVGNREYLYDARYYKNGALKHTGKLFVEYGNVSRENKELDTSFLIFSYGAISEGLSIRDVVDDVVDLGAGPAAIAVTAKAASLLSYPESKICFPTIRNENFYSGDEYNPELFNVWSQGEQEFKYNEDGSTQYSLLPQVYLLHVLEKCFTHFGFTIKGDVFSNEKARKIHLVGRHAIDKLREGGAAEIATTYDQIMPIGVWTDVDWGEVIKDETDGGVTIPSTTPYPAIQFEQYIVIIKLQVGAFSGSQFRIWYDSDAGTSWDGPFVPTANEEFVINSGYTPFVTQNIGLKIIVDGGEMEVLEGSNFFIYSVGNFFNETNIWRGTFDLKDCVPDIEISSFLKFAKRVLCCDITTNSVSKEVDISFCKTKLNSAPQSLIIPEDYQKETFANERIRLKWDNEDTNFDESVITGQVASSSELPEAMPTFAFYQLNTNQFIIPVHLGDSPPYYEWQVAATDLKSAYVGAGEIVDFSMGAKIPDMVEVSDGTNDVLVPSFSGQGSTYLKKQGTRSWDLAVSLYHGLQEGSLDTYPFSSPYHVDLQGNIVSDFSLKMTEPVIGLFETFMKEWFEARARSVRVKVKTLIPGRNPEELIGMPIVSDNQKFLVEEIAQKDEDDGLSEALIYLRKLNSK